jgi:DNA-binding XRE family transcriptional regulator
MVGAAAAQQHEENPQHRDTPGKVPVSRRLAHLSGRPTAGDAVGVVSVRERRLALGLTQEELAARSGVSVRSIQAFEAGRFVRPRPTTARLLADALELAPPSRERFLLALLDRSHRDGQPVRAE